MVMIVMTVSDVRVVKGYLGRTYKLWQPPTRAERGMS